MDILTVTDKQGKVFYRTCNPSVVGDDQANDAFVQYVLQKKAPVSSADIVQQEELAKESQKLADQAAMEITKTPMAGPSEKTQVVSGMMLKGAAPVFTGNGQFVGCWSAAY